MQTRFNDRQLQHPETRRANRILRSCVHCGFCNATCPTYQLLGDELDGPRGRIYLIKQVLEGQRPGRRTQQHLDRCLTCRNCESTCPSGVRYGELLDIGRLAVNRQVPRPLAERGLHLVLRKVFLNRRVFRLALGIGQWLRPVLPASIRKTVPARQPAALTESMRPHQRKVLLVEGCVQPALKPAIDLAARQLFDRAGIECVRLDAAGCCGSLSHHLNAEDEADAIIRRNIDVWWPLVESGAIEAITMTASGCGVAIRDYPGRFDNDPEYAEKARKIRELYRDPIEILLPLAQTIRAHCRNTAQRIAFHPPCTLQHGMKIHGQVETLLRKAGYDLLRFQDSHLCCGSAGTYSITQKRLSHALRRNKLQRIMETQPQKIVTANIGCQLHLQGGVDIPVVHWLELLASDLRTDGQESREPLNSQA